MFLIKCSILKEHISTCLDPSKRDQDGEPHIETSQLPGRGLSSSGSRKGPCLAMGQKPAGFVPTSHVPTPLLAALGETGLQAPVLRGVLGVHSTILTSVCTTTDCLNYQWAHWGNQSGVRSSGAVYKSHSTLGQRSSPWQCSNPRLYKNCPWGSPRNNALAKTLISLLMAPEQNLPLL